MSDSDFKKLVPEHIRALGPYTPGKPLRQAQRESGIGMIKLASNENPFGPSPKAIDAIRQCAAAVHLYPDNDSTELRARLAEKHQVAPENVIVTDGSTVALDLLARALLAPGLNAITSERSFIVYPIATRAAGATLIQVPTRDDGFDLDAIAAAIDAHTRLIFIANPNNPTGTMFDADAFDRFLARVPDHVVVVLDEAYSDFGAAFAADRGLIYSRSLDHVRAGRRNVVVLRTFSKAHGLAGLRVGYAFGDPELLQYIGRVKTAFSVSAVAEAAALAAMADDDHIRKTVENNRRGAAELTQALRDLGVRVVPTAANFIYFECDDAAAVAKRIQAEGVIVRPLAAWGIPNAIRVTIGTPEQNQRFVAALKKAIAPAVVGR
jgi:histidinol-phosphate aminotransferase